MNTFKDSILILVLIICCAQITTAQWTQINFPSSEDLYMVRFASETTGWVVGSDYVYKTTNGGISWLQQDTVYGGGCEALYAIDTSEVIYSDYGQKGIRISTDGGINWFTSDNQAYTYYDIKFVNHLLGFAAGGSNSSNDSGIVRRTIDGGLTWNTIASVYFANRGYEFDGISFPDSLNGWAVSYKGWVYRTTDGGFNWAFQDSVGSYLTPYPVILPCRDIEFIDANNGWVVGGIAGNSLMARTTDGGQNWSIDSLYPLTNCSVVEINMINSNIGWFVGRNNGGAFIAKTINGGATWTDQLDDSINPYGFNSISMVNELVGYAVGLDGKVYKTTNGGVTLVDENNLYITAYELSQNFPNPFNPSTKISWQLPEASFVTLKIFNSLGEEVETLVNEFMNAGTHSKLYIVNSALPSGVYFYQLKAGDYLQTKKMILIK